MWMEGRTPKLRTKYWLWATDTFAKNNFSVPQYDRFDSEATFSSDEAMETLIEAELTLQKQNTVARDYALEIAKRVNGLKAVRAQLHD